MKKNKIRKKWAVTCQHTCCEAKRFWFRSAAIRKSSFLNAEADRTDLNLIFTVTDRKGSDR